MGTNYYLHEEVCPTCKRAGETLHIGKSSAGWCFSLRVHPEEGINSLADWRARWSRPGSVIHNEYGEAIEPDVMDQHITERSWPDRGSNDDPNWYECNHAEPGPNGLARHKIGQGCVGHGVGTWDLIEGEFG